MKIAFYGSSLLSSYWNGAATYYRGLIQALAGRGHNVTFYEPDAFDRQSHRDIEPPDWCEVVVYEATPDGLRSAVEEAKAADVVVKASGVGYGDDELLEGALQHARRDAVTVWWDVDAPATLSEIEPAPDHPIRRALASIDLVLTYGGGTPVSAAYEALGAAACVPIYNALDPATHHPVPAERRFAADLAFLGNRLPDREARVEGFFLGAARLRPQKRFLMGGSGWDDKPMPSNVALIGHVGTADHNAFNVSPLAVLNITRESMARTGFSPPTRVFEAAGAGACLITDAWPGIDAFLEPGREVLVARDGQDVAEMLGGLDQARAAQVGQAALRRVLAGHTYDLRALEVERVLMEASERKRAELAA